MLFIQAEIIYDNKMFQKAVSLLKKYTEIQFLKHRFGEYIFVLFLLKPYWFVSQSE